MGLDTSHNAWHGSYSSFNQWRRVVAELAGFPPLKEMEGFGGNRRWSEVCGCDLRLIPLLHHSDCDGQLTPKECLQIADALQDLLNKPWPEEWLMRKTYVFMDGCRHAAKANEPLDFH